MKSTVSLLLLATTALAATPAHAQSADPNAAASSAASSDDINALRAQIQAMQARLDKIEADKAAAATAAASAKPAAAAPSWTSGTTIGGKAFLNASYIDQKSDGADTGQKGFQADVKRFYLTVDHKFSDVFSANLTTDFRYSANGTSKDVLVYVKKAYLQAKLAPEFYIRLGASDLPWVPFVEDLYGNRYIENVMVDRTKYGTSADWGVHIGGTFGKGLVSYAASAVNGAGYKTLSRSSDTVDLEGRVSVQPVKGVTFAVGGYTGKLGKSAGNLPNTNHRATRLDALAAYTNGPIRAGVEYFTAKNWNNVTTVAEDKTTGWSAFGSFAVTKQIGVFGRYDWVNPNKLTNSAMSDDYFNFGVSYNAMKNVDFALVYKREKVDNGILSTSNGSIGGVHQGTYDEFGLWSQVKF